MRSCLAELALNLKFCILGVLSRRVEDTGSSFGSFVGDHCTYDGGREDAMGPHYYSAGPRRMILVCATKTAGLLTFDGSKSASGTRV